MLNLHSGSAPEQSDPWLWAHEWPKWLRDLVCYLAEAYECRRAALILPLAPAFDTTALRAHAHAGYVVVCLLDSLEKSDTSAALDVLRAAMQWAPVGIVVLQERRRMRVLDVGGWTQLLEQAGLRAAFSGKAHDAMTDSLVAILLPPHVPDIKPAPDDFRLLAIVPTYNEEDVIEQTLRYLTLENVEVHLLDNWSTDSTTERAAAFLGRGLRAIERFPPEHATGTYDLALIMGRAEQIHAQSRWASWVMLHDADERRRSPWSGVGLRDALWYVERCGFSCVDHVTLNFWPTDNGFDRQGADLEDHFRYFEFSAHSGHFHQRRAWRQQGQPVLLTASAGHDVQFENRRVYPFKFLLKHYPVRSDAHGARKVLHERMSRFNPQERELGWHRQYDALSARSFLRDPATLTRFDPDTFETNYVIERLSGINIFERPPTWATGPRW